MFRTILFLAKIRKENNFVIACDRVTVLAFYTFFLIDLNTVLKGR